MISFNFAKLNQPLKTPSIVNQGWIPDCVGFSYGAHCPQQPRSTGNFGYLVRRQSGDEIEAWFCKCCGDVPKCPVTVHTTVVRYAMDFGYKVKDVSSDDFYDRMGFRVHQVNTQMSVNDVAPTL